eukprot:gene4028-4406_t
MQEESTANTPTNNTTPTTTTTTTNTTSTTTTLTNTCGEGSSEQKESVHLKLHEIILEQSDEEDIIIDNTTHITIYQFLHRTTQQCLLATASSKKNLELFSLYIYHQNLSQSIEEYEYRESHYAYNDKVAFHQFEEVWKEGHFLAISPDFTEQWKPEHERRKKTTLASLLNANTRRYLVNYYKYKREDGRDNLVRLKQFAIWVKEQFPYYYGQCLQCGEREGSSFLGMLCPSEEEKRFQTGKTELYYCSKCGFFSRFPRYIDVSEVLVTHRGRCGEYSVLMLLFAESLGYRARWVVDRDDHVWIEVQCEIDGNGDQADWFHVDPCEAAIDEPLIYQGWGKNQTYIVAYSPEGILDRTWHYTNKPDGVRDRRLEEGLTIEDAEKVIMEANVDLKRQLEELTIRLKEKQSMGLEEERREDINNTSMSKVDNNTSPQV